VARAARQRLSRTAALPLLLGLAAASPGGAAFAASPPAVEAAHAMVVSDERRATEVGLSILRAGGNAVDAAVAVGYALAVVGPCCGNIGGGGFLTLHLSDGRDRVIDFRETAPAAASAGMFLGADGRPVAALSRLGWRAIAVPGTVMGLDRAAREYGRLPAAQLIQPAIALARDGFALGPAEAELLAAKADLFRRDPAAAKIFLRADGRPFAAGDRLVQADLAATLSAIAKDGPRAFYAGPVAVQVAEASRNNGGLLSEGDFAAYRTEERPPLSCSYRGYRLLSAPPPSSGGVAICEILGILEGYDLRSLGFRSAGSVRLLVEAMRRAYRDRNSELGDPGFVDNPVARLLSPEHVRSIRAEIDGLAAAGNRASPPGSPGEKPETTHYSVVDAAGNAVAVTYTLNGYFGAGVVAPGTGFLLNNEMDDFTAKPGAANLYGLVQGEKNAVAPGKRPLSSMAPTIAESGGSVFLVLGSPGGPRIITAVAEAISNIVDYGMTPQEAVDAPRLHFQGEPDRLFYERFGLSPDTATILVRSGYKPVEERPWGAVELIELAGGRLYGASDSRRPAGAALGY
jgi:gamma-glutamyltranspeptidase/glutathione hydrolase